MRGNGRGLFSWAEGKLGELTEGLVQQVGTLVSGGEWIGNRVAKRSLWSLPLTMEQFVGWNTNTMGLNPKGLCACSTTARGHQRPWAL